MQENAQKEIHVEDDLDIQTLLYVSLQMSVPASPVFWL